jgi:hypothetical protein
MTTESPDPNKAGKTGLLLRSLNSGAAGKLVELAWTEIERELIRLHGPDGLDLPGEILIGVGTNKVGVSSDTR